MTMAMTCLLQNVHPDLSIPVSYTVVNIDPNDHETMTPILQGQFRELNAAYCDKENRCFHVFETPTGSKFILTQSPQGFVVPMLLTFTPPPLMDPNQMILGPRMTPHPAIPLSHYNFQMTPTATESPVASSKIEINPGVETPVKIVGMKKFLVNAIKEGIQKNLAVVSSKERQNGEVSSIVLSDGDEDEMEIPLSNVNFLDSPRHFSSSDDWVEEKGNRTIKFECPKLKSPQNDGRKNEELEILHPPESFKDKQTEHMEEVKSSVINYLNASSKISKRVHSPPRQGQLKTQILTPPLTTVARRILKPSRAGNLETLTDNILRTCLRVTARTEAVAAAQRQILEKNPEPPVEKQDSPITVQISQSKYQDPYIPPENPVSEYNLPTNFVPQYLDIPAQNLVTKDSDFPTYLEPSQENPLHFPDECHTEALKFPQAYPDEIPQFIETFLQGMATLQKMYESISQPVKQRSSQDPDDKEVTFEKEIPSPVLIPLKEIPTATPKFLETFRKCVSISEKSWPGQGQREEKEVTFAEDTQDSVPPKESTELTTKVKKRISETGESVTSEDFYTSYLDKSHVDSSEEIVRVHPDILLALQKYNENYERSHPPIQFDHRSFTHRPNQDLTKLVLQRVADDLLLEIIGKTVTHLKYLDISGSPLVTNDGIKHLFVKSAKENSSLYLMSSWIHKNTNVMNKIVFTLEYFDYSYTSANFYSRRLVNLFPGAYVFQRIFHLGEDYFGHHIFCRRSPDFASSSKGADKNNDFEIQLRLAVGNRGASNFCKFLEHHGWKNCFVVVRDEDKCRKIPVKFKRPIVALVTASKEEKRIYGQVTFEGGLLSSLYSLFPVDMTAVGEFCSTLQTLSGHITNTWKRKCYFLPNLTKLNAILEPSTLISIFQSCPTLKYVKIRVRDGPLTDQDILKSLQNSLSTRNLLEISILPGFFKPAITTTSTLHKTSISNSCRKQSDLNSTLPLHASSVRKERSSIILSPRKPSTLNETNLIDGFELKRDENDKSSSHGSENSCKLSIKSAKAFFFSCPNLVRLGNLAWWGGVTRDEFDKLNYQRTKGGDCGNVHLEWDSILLPQLDVSADWDG